ncbi:hypothetical protein O181_090976 [Austropuccinia psidii MF-1]|uniref:Uncharacterized protein n=1 Tax=Austropuccinia psidii MF-1 TaxID=1389203 RepID=A0A9Q3IWI1_9BASI|nr:hypothetical protein [Austropuccinia psidii MF-1]
MLVMLSDKNTRNACLFSNPFNCAARGVPAQDALERTPLWSAMMKAFLSRNGFQDPKQADGNTSGLLALCPQVLICPPPLQDHHPMVNLLLNQSKVIIHPMKDGNGKRTFELGPIVTMSCPPWDSNAKFFPLHIEQNPPSSPQQDSPVPCMPCEQTAWQPTSRLSGTRWLQDLFCGKQSPFPFLILPFALSELTFPAFVEPSQHHEPPIPEQVNPPNHMRMLQLVSLNLRWL